jgi:hypothetical protein
MPTQEASTSSYACPQSTAENMLFQVHLHFLPQKVSSQAQHITIMLTHLQLYSRAEFRGAPS